MNRLRLRRLEAHRTGGIGDKMELSLPAPKTPSGKVYRCCPDEGCAPRLFLLGEAPEGQFIPDEQQALIRRAPATSGTTCCYCGTDAADSEFHWSRDVDAITDYLTWAVGEDIGDFLHGMASDFNRKVGRGGLISMKMEVKERHHPKPFVWREDLLRDLTCDICGRAYGVYAVALFCPDCGGRNVHVHFAREVALVRSQVELAEKVESESDGELAYRLLGNAHEDVLTAFETYMKTIYRFLVRRRFPPAEAEKRTSKKARGSAVQNSEGGRRLFATVNEDPYSCLSAEELEFMRLNIEKRHVVGHNLSMADEAYQQATNSEDPGQTVRLLAADVLSFATLSQRIVCALEDGSSEFLPAQTSNTLSTSSP